MLTLEERLAVVNLYEELGSYRAVAAMVGCDHKTCPVTWPASPRLGAGLYWWIRPRDGRNVRPGRRAGLAGARRKFRRWASRLRRAGSAMLRSN